MAYAARDAGKITGNTTAELQANLNKLMEQGKAISYEILPHFAKQLSIAARKNDALNYAIHELYSVQLGRAKIGMQEFQNSIWNSGMREGLSYMLRAFGDLLEVSKPLSTFLGYTLRNAIATLAFPFKMLAGIVRDVAAMFGVELDGSLGAIAGKITGIISAVIMLVGAFKLLAKSMKLVKTAASLVQTVADKGVDMIPEGKGKGRRGRRGGGGGRTGGGKLGKSMGFVSTLLGGTTVGVGASMIPDFSPVKMEGSTTENGLVTGVGLNQVLEDLSSYSRTVGDWLTGQRNQSSLQTNLPSYLTGGGKPIQVTQQPLKVTVESKGDLYDLIDVKIEQALQDQSDQLIEPYGE